MFWVGAEAPIHTASVMSVQHSFRRVAFALGLCAAVLVPPALSAQQQGAPKIPISVWKTRTCGCCTLWVDHMRANGFDVKVEDVDDVGPLKRKLGVAPGLSSCHTAQAGRYVIEGHVPADVVRRLLKERPTTVVGIAVPGMPIGSPGMEVPGGGRQPYAVLTFDKAGQTTVYDKR
jgi:hypothetical protein